MEFLLHVEHLYGLSDIVNTPEHLLRSHCYNLSPKQLEVGTLNRLLQNANAANPNANPKPWGLVSPFSLNLRNFYFDFSEDVAGRKSFKHTF